MTPTALELWYEGNYVMSFFGLELFRKGNKFFGVGPRTNRVIELNDVDLEIMFR